MYSEPRVSGKHVIFKGKYLEQARAEDFQIGEALIFPARGAREKFLSATPKFLSATPIFGF